MEDRVSERVSVCTRTRFKTEDRVSEKVTSLYTHAVQDRR